MYLNSRNFQQRCLYPSDCSETKISEWFWSLWMAIDWERWSSAMFHRKCRHDVYIYILAKECKPKLFIALCKWSPASHLPSFHLRSTASNLRCWQALNSCLVIFCMHATAAQELICVPSRREQITKGSNISRLHEERSSVTGATFVIVWFCLLRQTRQFSH